jgi:hypothetical protein
VAQLPFGDVEAALAKADSFFELRDGSREPLGLWLGGAEQVIGDALR